ncbi:DUF429 domain-containing protein [Luteimonas sp. S4-F44]|uniref:DUF429 domain-containing protein n=1 Tax=Luteimonas sp. S4-F44 TaxID=2925842 RepID=UPI001F52E841|nr:DUF429 domain-containing protein [Luteimonas sp. S4-F44]UNK41357.1 DUF429 domain-containing protein [Luteimonas sp. S4-F44]
MDCVGVDGAGAGWFAVWRASAGLTFAVYASPKALLDDHRRARVVAVDVPIGLAEHGARPVDRLARRFVGGRRVARQDAYTPPEDVEPAEAADADDAAEGVTMGVYAKARAAQAAEVPADFVFGVTIDQADALDRLVQTLMAHGDVLASGHDDDLADATISTLGLAISEGADTVREILEQVQEQQLHASSRPPTGVREPRPTYGAALH